MMTNPRPLALVILFAFGPQIAMSQIRTDGSLGQGAESLAGPNYAILESLGKRAGNNLFHSFQTFKVGAGETATFSTTTPTIANVIGRVTGGEVSTIKGALKLQAAAGTPALYLVNPAGVTFGAGSSIDVPGAFHVSTADYIKFPDGNFYVEPAKASTLSAAPPEAFGFLGQGSGKVSLQGAILTLPTELDLTAGEISIAQSKLNIPAGTLRLVATGPKVVDVPLAEPPTSPLSGGINVTNSTLDATGNGGGHIGLHGGDITIAGSKVLADNVGALDAPSSGNGVILNVANLSLASSTISSNSGGAGNAASIRVSATGTVDIQGDFSGIESQANDSGRAGDITLAAANVSIDGALSGIDSSSFGSGTAGSIDLRIAGTLALSNKSSAFSTIHSRVGSDAYATGAAGNITIQAKDIESHKGTISSASAAQGNSGGVSLLVENAVRLSDSILATSALGGGQAGSVSVVAKYIELTDSSQVSSDGAGGRLTISADSIKMSSKSSFQIGTLFGSTGDGGGMLIDANEMILNDSKLVGTTMGNYRAGDLTIRVRDNFEARNDSWIDSSVFFGNGQAGKVNLTAGNVILDQSTISSQTIISTSGVAGAVSILAHHQLSLSNRSVISTSTDSSNPGGDVIIRAKEVIIANSDVASYTTGIGKAGNVHLLADQSVELSENAVLTSATIGQGGGGVVRVVSPRVSFFDSSVNSAAGKESRSGAGGVVIEAHDALTLTGDSYITSATWSPTGRGGTVDITTGRLTINGNAGDLVVGITAEAKAGSSGMVGTVNVSATDGIALNNRASITINNLATVTDPFQIAPSTLRITAPWISLDQSSITASSSGNIAASGVQVTTDRLLLARDSRIVTTSNEGNGGSIDVNGGSFVKLDNSSISTSVFGAQGNGGDISVTARTLALNTGFIQANTAAQGNSGGDVQIQVEALLPSHSSLIKGGNTILIPQNGISGYNLIQAAAPTGVSGNIAINSPQIDLAGSLIGLSAKAMEAERLGKSPCQGGGSSLGIAGRGGLAPSYKALANSTVLALATTWLPETGNLYLAGTPPCPIH